MKPLLFLSFKNWARLDSNQRPKDYESSALPLRHKPILVYLIVALALPTSHKTILNRFVRQSATSPWRLFYCYGLCSVASLPNSFKNDT